MNDTKDKQIEDGELSTERVQRVGDYFKSLFVRSLKLALDDGVRGRPWEALSEPAERAQTLVSIEADSSLPAASAENDGQSQEEEAI
jgi:hypothetical protein